MGKMFFFPAGDGGFVVTVEAKKSEDETKKFPFAHSSFPPPRACVLSLFQALALLFPSRQSIQTRGTRSRRNERRRPEVERFVLRS